MNEKLLQEKLECYHCGESCDDSIIDSSKQHHFCCLGCRSVYNILLENGMDSYYKLESQPGVNNNKSSDNDYSYLDQEDVQEQLFQFHEDGIFRISFNVPQIHCSSCLWLLENIHQINKGISSSHVNFTKKKVDIVAKSDEITLKELVKLLRSIGYEPQLNLESLQENKKTSSYNKSTIYKLGLAGFAFGNIMLLSFPEYLGFENSAKLFFLGYINIALAIPVFFYSGFEYIRSAWLSIKANKLNLDVPIALGMVVLFGRSIYEIMMGVGEGYLDSFTGFIFFLLIGKWFQSFTFQSLDFDRKFSAYFPISASLKSAGNWVSTSLNNLKKQDVILVRNQEIIPCDGVITKGKARIDYSFVTGESKLISKTHREKVYCGGKNCGESIEVKVLKNVDQSYLTQLWKEETFSDTESSEVHKLINNISKYFIYIILVLATVSFGIWAQTDLTKAIDVFTAVLIVACPCALALSIPFTYGQIIRLLAKSGLYLKNVETIEKMQDIDHIVFDKTGTLTNPNDIQVTFEGSNLTDQLKAIIKSSCVHSSHPLSQAIVKYLEFVPLIEIDNYQDFIGEGFKTEIGRDSLKVGSSDFIFGKTQYAQKGVFVELNGQYIGHFSFEHALRDGIHTLMSDLNSKYQIQILSGDLAIEKDKYSDLVKSNQDLIFEQNPMQKLEHIKDLQEKGKKIMMIGDGLNDAGALSQADVGLVFTDQATNFSPACDGIFLAKNSNQLKTIFAFIKRSRWIIYGAFTLAFLYNIVGLYFAISGQLRPVIAAIIMPLSSITIIFYAVSSSYISYFLGVQRKSDSEDSATIIR